MYLCVLQVCADPNSFNIDSLTANDVAKVDTDCTEDYIGIESMYFRLKYLHMCSRGFKSMIMTCSIFLHFVN